MGGTVGHASKYPGNVQSISATEIQNQNPLEPQKDTEFIAQLAQFDTLNQMRALNQAMSHNTAMKIKFISASAIPV